MIYAMFPFHLIVLVLEVDRISASVSVSAPNVDKWPLSADIRFRPKAESSRITFGALSVSAGCSW